MKGAGQVDGLLLRCDGQPWDGGADPAGQPPARSPERRGTELQPPSSADRSSGRTERRKELRPGKFCGQVNRTQ